MFWCVLYAINEQCVWNREVKMWHEPLLNFYYDIILSARNVFVNNIITVFVMVLAVNTFLQLFVTVH